MIDLNIFRTALNKQNKRLANIYGAKSSIQYRASNMCNLLFGYILVTSALIIFALIVEGITSFSNKRLFYISFLGFMTASYVIFYLMTMKGFFRIARFAFIALNVLFMLPAVILTGGLPNAPAMIILPLPILYAFCLYEGRNAIRFTGLFSAAILMIILIPAIFNITLPDFSQTDTSQGRRVITFLILMGMVAFTLITMQHENSRAVKKANEAASAKSDFLANMSHELRTPMNGVLGLTEVLMSKDMPNDQRKLLSVVHTSGQSLLTIINDILDFSKLESGQVELDPKPFDLKSLLDDTQDLLKIKAEEKRLYLSMGYPDDVPHHFIGDDNRLRQIILNVLGNAIKFTNEGGVTITTAFDNGDRLRINIRDTGIGIPSSKFEQIFDQFTQAESSTTRKFGGTGLGLAISRNIARAMGGDITIQSVVGKGSTFSVTLPLKINMDAAGTPPNNQSGSTGLANAKSGASAHPVIFLSKTEKLMSLFQSHAASSGYNCLACHDMTALKQIIMDNKSDPLFSPTVIISWGQSLEDFLPYAEKIRNVAPDMNVTFLLCVKSMFGKSENIPHWIASVKHPLSAANMVQTIEVLKATSIIKRLKEPRSTSAG